MLIISCFLWLIKFFLSRIVLFIWIMFEVWVMRTTSFSWPLIWSGLLCVMNLSAVLCWKNFLILMLIILIAFFVWCQTCLYDSSLRVFLSLLVCHHALTLLYDTLLQASTNHYSEDCIMSSCTCSFWLSLSYTCTSNCFLWLCWLLFNVLVLIACGPRCCTLFRSWFSMCHIDPVIHILSLDPNVCAYVSSFFLSSTFPLYMWFFMII